MRRFGILVNKSSALHEVQIPGSRLARVSQSLRRRLDDDVEDVFLRACATSDLEAAADLLTVLEKWHARRSSSYGRERRISGAALQRARKELDRLCVLRGVSTSAAKVKPDDPAAA
jgi:hypothetical protein